MREISFTVLPDQDGIRADTFLRRHCGLSYRTLVRLKRIEQGITANGELLRSIDIVHQGDCVIIRIPENRPAAEPNALPIDIIYEDNDIIICNKPPNMPVHPSRGHANDTLANAVASHLSAQGEFYAFRPVNRLDRDTSGLVICAKNSYAAANLNQRTEKTYMAICEGIIEEDGTVALPIRVKEGHGIQREVGAGGEIAITHYKVLDQGGKHTLLQLTLETGRTHQIRVHLSHLGHPLAGDDMYGGSRKWMERQALHCKTIQFMHPVIHKKLYFDTPLPFDMENLYKSSGIF